MDSYDSYSIALEQQMFRVEGAIGPLVAAINEARAFDCDVAFLREADMVSSALIGEPGDAALEVYRDLDKNLEQVNTFLRRWKTRDGQPYRGVVRTALATQHELEELKRFVEETPPWILAEIKKNVANYRQMKAGGCSPVILVPLVGVALLAWVTAS